MAGQQQSSFGNLNDENANPNVTMAELLLGKDHRQKIEQLKDSFKIENKGNIWNLLIE